MKNILSILVFFCLLAGVWDVPAWSAWDLIALGTQTDVSSGDLTLDEPAGCQEGDLIVAAIAYRDSAAFTLPADWILAATQQSSGDTDATQGIASGVMAYIVRGSSAPSYAFTRTGGNVARGRTICYRGNASSPRDTGGAETLASIGHPALAGITTAEANEFLVVMIAHGDNSTTSGFNATDPGTASDGTDTTTEPTAGTWIERQDEGTNTGADTGLFIADAVKSTSGATGSFSATAQTQSRSVTIAAAFKIYSGASYDHSTALAQASAYSGLGVAAFSGNMALGQSSAYSGGSLWSGSNSLSMAQISDYASGSYLMEDPPWAFVPEVSLTIPQSETLAQISSHEPETPSGRLVGSLNMDQVSGYSGETGNYTFSLGPVALNQASSYSGSMGSYIFSPGAIPLAQTAEYGAGGGQTTASGLSLIQASAYGGNIGLAFAVEFSLAQGSNYDNSSVVPVTAALSLPQTSSYGGGSVPSLLAGLTLSQNSGYSGISLQSLSPNFVLSQMASWEGGAISAFLADFSLVQASAFALIGGFIFNGNFSLTQTSLYSPQEFMGGIYYVSQVIPAYSNVSFLGPVSTPLSLPVSTLASIPLATILGDVWRTAITPKQRILPLSQEIRKLGMNMETRILTPEENRTFNLTPQSRMLVVQP